MVKSFETETYFDEDEVDPSFVVALVYSSDKDLRETVELEDDEAVPTEAELMAVDADEPEPQGDVDGLIDEDDIVGLYLLEIRQYPLLTEDEEKDLFTKIKNGDMEARDRFLKSNTRLAIWMAKRYKGRGVSFLDLIQAGNDGLMYALSKYDERYGNRFATYATYWVRQKIVRELALHSNTIRRPMRHNGHLRLYLDTVDALEDELGRKPTDKEVSLKSGLTVRNIQNLRTKARVPISLNQVASLHDDTQREIGELIEDPSSPQPAIVAELLAMSELAERMLSVLTDRQRQVMEMLYGFYSDIPKKNYTEVGRRLGVSHTRIQQIERDAIFKIHRKFYPDHYRSILSE